MCGTIGHVVIDLKTLQAILVICFKDKLVYLFISRKEEYVAACLTNFCILYAKILYLYSMPI